MELPTGEITRLRAAERMDQGCAFGNRRADDFDGDRLDTQEFQVRDELHFVVVDLAATRTLESEPAERCYRSGTRSSMGAGAVGSD